MKCIVKNCLNRDGKKSDSRISFHRFPKNPLKRKLWMEALALVDVEPLPRDIVCSQHFDDDSFTVSKDGRAGLKKGALPTCIDPIKLVSSDRINNFSNFEFVEIDNTFKENTSLKIIDFMEAGPSFASSPNIKTEYESSETSPKSEKKYSKKMTLKEAIKNTSQEDVTSETSSKTRLNEEKEVLRNHVLKAKRKIKILNQALRRYRKKIVTVKEKIMPNEKPLISTHVLDTSLGKPAANLPVILSKFNGNSWQLINNVATDSDGRCPELISSESFTPGMYKLNFNVDLYFRATNRKTIYPHVEIVFICEANQHYHIPLLLNPFGYSTYQGS